MEDEGGRPVRAARSDAPADERSPLRSRSHSTRATFKCDVSLSRDAQSVYSVPAVG